MFAVRCCCVATLGSILGLEEFSMRGIRWMAEWQCLVRCTYELYVVDCNMSYRSSASLRQLGWLDVW